MRHIRNVIIAGILGAMVSGGVYAFWSAFKANAAPPAALALPSRRTLRGRTLRRLLGGHRAVALAAHHAEDGCADALDRRTEGNCTDAALGCGLDGGCGGRTRAGTRLTLAALVALVAFLTSLTTCLALRIRAWLALTARRCRVGLGRALARRRQPPPRNQASPRSTPRSSPGR